MTRVDPAWQGLLLFPSSSVVSCSSWSYSPFFICVLFICIFSFLRCSCWLLFILQLSHEQCCTVQSDVYTARHLILAAHSVIAAMCGPARNKVDLIVT